MNKRYAIFLVLILGLAGCASLKESCKGVMGISTKILEESRKDAVTKEFVSGRADLYAKTKEALKEIKAHVYADDAAKGMIAIYISEEDTTPVGIFFSEVDKDKTKVEISSASTYGKEHIAEKLFPLLEKK